MFEAYTAWKENKWDGTATEEDGEYMIDWVTEYFFRKIVPTRKD